MIARLMELLYDEATPIQPNPKFNIITIKLFVFVFLNWHVG